MDSTTSSSVMAALEFDVIVLIYFKLLFLANCPQAACMSLPLLWRRLTMMFFDSRKAINFLMLALLLGLKSCEAVEL